MEFDLNVRDFIPLVVLAIPIIAITGGIIAGIVRTMGRQRIIELAQRERIAAIERGIDPAKLPPLPVLGSDQSEMVRLLLEDERCHHDPREGDRRLYRGLLIGGIITLAVGLGPLPILFFDDGFRFSHGLLFGLGAMSFIPAAVGVGLIVSALLVRPRNGKRDSGGPPNFQGPPSSM